MHTTLFKLIRKDHEKILSVFGKLKNSKGSDSAKRQGLFEKLSKKITSHLKTEESTFYQLLLAKKKAHEKALEGTEEHKIIEMTLKGLEKMGKSEDRWEAKIHVLQGFVEHHFQEEESKIFKSAKKSLSDDEIQNIVKQFEQEKQKNKKPIKQAPRKGGEIKV